MIFQNEQLIQIGAFVVLLFFLLQFVKCIGDIVMVFKQGGRRKVDRSENSADKVMTHFLNIITKFSASLSSVEVSLNHMKDSVEDLMPLFDRVRYIENRISILEDRNGIDKRNTIANR